MHDTGDPRSAPLTFHQERLWFIDAFERGRVYAGPPTYHNIAVLLRIDGVVEPGLLDAAINDVVARDEALRISIEHGRQRIAASVRVPLAMIDLAASDDEAMVLALDDSRRPFFLEKGALVRAVLYRQSAARALLALTLHHIVADLASTRIVIEGIVEAYTARAGGATPAWTPAMGFATYASWLRGLPDNVFDAALAFWRWQTQGGLAPLELPYARRRPHVHVYEPAVRRVLLAPDRIGPLEAVAAHEQAALADVVLTAWVATLYACARQGEIVIGTSHPNRDARFERMVGPLANLLVLRFKVGRTKPVAELLRHVRRTVRQAVANRAIPFDRLVQHLKAAKDMSRTALFDVMYEFLDPEPTVWQTARATFTRLDSFAGFGKYDLHLTLRPASGGVSGTLEYNTELFASAFIDDLLAIFDASLHRLADGLQSSLEGHVRLPAPLAESQLALLRAGTAVRPAHPTLDAAFEAAAARWPDRIAITCDATQVSYGTLARAARRVSQRLIDAGALPGAAVAVFLDRSPEAIAAMLGILRIGAAYVPIDPAYPPLRVSRLLEDSEAALVVTSAALTPVVRSHVAGRAVTVIDVASAMASSAAARRRARAAGMDVAYSIYTSGSTGQPKGCLVTHQNVVSLLLGETAAFAFSEEDVWSQAHSFCFDFSVWEIFGALLHGARGVLLSGETVRDPALLRLTLAREQVTILSQTPAAGYRLAEAPDDLSSTRSLRCLVFGGDMLIPKRLETWARARPHVAIVNMYGITETTVHVTQKWLTLEETAQDSRSVGRALPGVSVYVVGSGIDLVPMGVPGEIAVGGQGVSLGYWKRPELTAERFVADPFSDRPGARLYLSGDLGRLLPGGEIAYVGRRDHQVKIRGYRIELGEIEAALAEHPCLADVAVVAKDTGAQHRTLAAYVVLRDETIAPEALRAYLRERLTPAMVPAVIQPIESLPKTPEGKIDRQMLADLALTSAASSRGYVAPTTDRERTLVRIWEDVLGRVPVGIADNLFDIGGDSILSMQICARAARVGLHLTPKQLFEYSTIEELVAHLARTHTAAAADASPGPTRAPLLPAQAWFFSQQHPDPHHFNQSAWFELAEDIQPEDVAEALRRLRALHEALRLVFVMRDDRIEQELGATGDDDVPLTIVKPETDTDDEPVRIVVEQAQRSLNIHTGPLFRGVYVTSTGSRPARLLLVVHHLITDSMSWRTIADDLGLLLARRDDAGTLPPAASLLRYACDRAAAQESPAPGAPDEDAALPIDIASPPGANTFAEYDEIEAGLDQAATTAIGDWLAHEKLGWDDALIASAGQALLTWTGRQTVAIDAEAHGRDLSAEAPDLSRTIGWFMRLHRVRVSQTTSPPDAAVREVHAEVVRAKASADLLTRDPATFEPGLCVNYLGRVDARSRANPVLRLVDGDMGTAMSPRNLRAHAIDLHGVILDGRLRLRWGFSRARHRRDTIGQLASACSAFLLALAATRERQTRSPERAEAFPLAPGQLGMLYHALRDSGGSPEYVVRWHLEIEGKLDVEAFRASWELLLARHEALRAWFTWDGPDGPVQRFADRVPLICPVHDWYDQRASGAGQRLEALMREFAAAPLDLASPPLLSLQLVRTAKQTHQALMRIHHLIVDGWSLAILREELLRAYRAFTERTAIDLPTPGRYREYLRHLAEQDTGMAEAFWRERLRGVRPCALPAMTGAAPAVAEHAILEAFDLSFARTRSLARWAAGHRLTLNTLVQGLWSVVLACLTKRSSIVTGVVVAGRPPELADVERTVGAFINTLPLRVDLEPSASLVAWLQDLQATVAASQRFAYWPLPQVCAWAGLAKAETLFDTVLVCENYPSPQPVPLRDVTIREAGYGLKESVPVVLEYSCSRFRGRLRYRPDLVDAATVSDAAELLRAGVAEVARDRELSAGGLLSVLNGAAAAASSARQRRFAASRRDALRGVIAGSSSASTTAGGAVRRLPKS